MAHSVPGRTGRSSAPGWMTLPRSVFTAQRGRQRTTCRYRTVLEMIVIARDLGDLGEGEAATSGLAGEIPTASILCHFAGKPPCVLQVVAGGVFSEEEEESPSAEESSSYFSTLCRYRLFEGSNLYPLAPS